ncbi:MAG: hypothetical protein SAK29_09685 [Scytonema sp. PMC 1069.18]|nr:hypothetical protein [Scytonema sp. PMC 1069.18]MEC4887070.1 hypothetical protein [Scytonema sp. PMC 1070.18]
MWCDRSALILTSGGPKQRLHSVETRILQEYGFLLRLFTRLALA